MGLNKSYHSIFLNRLLGKYHSSHSYPYTEDQHPIAEHVWLGLYTGIPEKNDSRIPGNVGHELSGTTSIGYKRYDLGDYTYGDYHALSNPAIMSGEGFYSCHNNYEIHFDENEGTNNWEAATYGVIFDAATGGHVLCWGKLKGSDGIAASIICKPHQVIIIPELSNSTNGLKISFKDGD